MLIRQCFKEYFINLNYKARDYIIHNREKVNLAGKIFTGIVCCFVFIFCIFPTVLDLIHMINNEYIYCVIEADYQYSSLAEDSAWGIVGYIHPEFVYDIGNSVIQYDDEKAEIAKKKVKLKVITGDYSYSKGDFYLVRYLPNTTCGEIVCSVSEIVEPDTIFRVMEK
ncbi:MAG: hypothetical protein K2J88_07655 [Oscillospiraceae bacterium]|nr:hypothetical protein [Oscillospiraceae bacterium]